MPPEGKGAVVGRRLVLVDDGVTSGVTVDPRTGAASRRGRQCDVLVFARVANPVRTSI
jgi:hypothetical protein